MTLKFILNAFAITAIFILSIQKLKAADDFPYGCIIYYNGAERVFTDFQFIDATSSRHYSLNTSYKQGTGTCEATITYGSPLGSGCTVDGATTGTMVTITALVNCPIDDHTPVLMLLSVFFSVLLIRKRARLIADIH